ncbi:hypothetical protein RRG08_013232 [Elysia crispata]|uniref:Uncharacterized protein n=1 Tax=Elysia crispata TaxID=231223 RepID=A0AAE1AGX7_9GAST|nr:hypothetical protein RRG08_013232 [Elysia crispata]
MCEPNPCAGRLGQLRHVTRNWLAVTDDVTSSQSSNEISSRDARSALTNKATRDWCMYVCVLRLTVYVSEYDQVCVLRLTVYVSEYDQVFVLRLTVYVFEYDQVFVLRLTVYVSEYDQVFEPCPTVYVFEYDQVFELCLTVYVSEYDQVFELCLTVYVFEYDQVCVLRLTVYVFEYDQVCVLRLTVYVLEYDQVCVLRLTVYVSEYDQVCVLRLTVYVSEYDQVFVLRLTVYVLEYDQSKTVNSARARLITSSTGNTGEICGPSPHLRQGPGASETMGHLSQERDAVREGLGCYMSSHSPVDLLIMTELYSTNDTATERQCVAKSLEVTHSSNLPTRSGIPSIPWAVGALEGETFL